MYLLGCDGVDKNVAPHRLPAACIHALPDAQASLTVLSTYYDCFHQNDAMYLLIIECLCMVQKEVEIAWQNLALEAFIVLMFVVMTSPRPSGPTSEDCAVGTLRTVRKHGAGPQLWRHLEPSGPSGGLRTPPLNAPQFMVPRIVCTIMSRFT